MDETAIRRENLRRYMEKYCDGNQSQLARRLGDPYSQSFISDRLRGARPIGEKLARALEQRLGLSPKELDAGDAPLNVRDSPQAAEGAGWPFHFDRDRWEGLTSDQRLQIEAAVEAMVFAFEARAPQPVAEPRQGKVVRDQAPRQPYGRKVLSGEKKPTRPSRRKKASGE